MDFAIYYTYQKILDYLFIDLYIDSYHNNQNIENVNNKTVVLFEKTKSSTKKLFRGSFCSTDS